MFETKPLSFSDAKRFLFFRFLSVLLWPADVFCFLFMPVWAFLVCLVAHLWITSRYYRLFLRLIWTGEAAAKT